MAMIAFAPMAANADSGKVVMIVADYLDMEDINSMEHLRRLALKSQIALMNNRQPGKASASKSKLIIGSGERLEIDSDTVSGGSEESFVKIFRMESGRKLLPGSLAFTDIYKVRNVNSNSEYLNRIGYIGDSINKNNGIACFIGNADTEVKNRCSMLITMDGNGEVDLGETEKIHINDEFFPYGIRTDYDRLADLYKQYLPASSFTVIETGDMERLEAFRSSMSEESYEFYKNDVLKKIDGFVNKVVRNNGYKTLVFISSYPSKTASEAGNKLTPVLVYEAGEAGVLYSKNTRREGIILNTDLADYLLFKLGYIKSCDITEHAMKEPVNYLANRNRSIVKTSILRAPVLTFYSAIVIAVLTILFADAVFFKKKPGQIWSKIGLTAAYTMLSMPIAFLLIPASYPGSTKVGYIAVTVFASVIFSAALTAALENKIKAIFLICLILQTGLAVDIISGSMLIKQSVFGYDPVIGARFYGIGNEYAGMFIGCSLIVLGCFQELGNKRITKAAAAAYFLACTCILGLSFLGANFGGALAGISGYLLAIFLVYDIKFNKKNILKGIIIMCLSAAVLLLTDSMGIFTQSHMGKIIKDTRMNGFGVVISTIKRKVSMNIRLMRYTVWTKVLLCITAVIFIMFYKPVKQMWDIFNKYRYLRSSWISIAASAAAGFAFNDSGIVSAAVAMIYAAFTMLIMCMGERNEY